MPSFSDIINAEEPVLIDFYANWCNPCMTMMPLMEELSGDLKGKVKIIKVDIDKNMPAVKQYQVMGVPTFILFKGGKQLWKKPGVIAKKEFLEVFKKHDLL